MIWLFNHFNAPFALPTSFWTTGDNNFLSLNTGGTAQASLISVCGGNVVWGFKQIETPAYSSEG